MYQEINEYEFMEQFRKVRPDDFSYYALQELFAYYDEFEDFELDVIAICCDVSEYTKEEIMRDYGYLLSEEDYKSTNYDDVIEMSEEDYEENYFDTLLDEIEQHTTVIEVKQSNNITPKENTYLIWCF